MKTYTKKPVKIEAIRLQRNNIAEVQSFIEGKLIDTSSSNMQSQKWDEYVDICHQQGGIRLKTLESEGETQLASFGDFVIKGIKREFYPCKPEIFDLTYSEEQPEQEGGGVTPIEKYAGNITARLAQLAYRVQDVLEKRDKALSENGYDLQNQFRQGFMLAHDLVKKAVGDQHPPKQQEWISVDKNPNLPNLDVFAIIEKPEVYRVVPGIYINDFYDQISLYMPLPSPPKPTEG